MNVVLARPSWRGWLHAAAFAAAIPAGIVLIVAAGGAAARTAVSIYLAVVLFGFGTSAAYHRLARSYRARNIWNSRLTGNFCKHHRHTAVAAGSAHTSW